MKKIREWLHDYFAMCEGNESLEKLLADLADREVNSFAEAHRQVNLRIDMMRAWLDGVRPAPEPAQDVDEGMMRAMGLLS